MSDTPLTNGNILKHHWSGCEFFGTKFDYSQTIEVRPRNGEPVAEVVSAEFARNLERRLSELIAFVKYVELTADRRSTECPMCTALGIKAYKLLNEVKP